jgi:hypothetical protein
MCSHFDIFFWFFLASSSTYRNYLAYQIIIFSILLSLFFVILFDGRHRLAIFVALMHDKLLAFPALSL